MSPRLPRRTWFVPVLIIWAVLVMPPLVFTQGTGQSTTQQTPPPKPTPPPPPPPPLPSGQDGTVRVVRRNGEAVFFEALSGVAMMLGGGRGGGKLADMSMPVPPDNPLTEARIALGRRLFNE
jgi:hypothetical protein